VLDLMATVVVDVRGLPECKRMLDQVQGRELNNRMRRSLRRGAKVFREKIRGEARSRSDIPRSFAKTRTRPHRNPLGVSVSPQSPLSTIFEHGARGHTIGSAGQILANTTVDRVGHAVGSGSRPFFAHAPVQHPGMAARPVIAPAFEKGDREATKAMGDELFKGLK
jgi:hypothetical protein